METPPTPQTLRTTYFGNELTVRGKLPNFPCQRPRRFYLQCHGGVLATEEEEETKMRGDGGGGRVSFGFLKPRRVFIQLWDIFSFSRFRRPVRITRTGTRTALQVRARFPLDPRERGGASGFFPSRGRRSAVEVGREVGSAEAFVRTTYPPPTHHLPTTYPPATHHLPTTYPLPTHPWLLPPPLPRSAPRCS